MHRTQIYLDDAQERALADRARRFGSTKSALIREAIDGYLAPAGEERRQLEQLRAAVADASGCGTYLPAGEDYVEQLRSADAERARELDARRG